MMWFLPKRVELLTLEVVTWSSCISGLSGVTAAGGRSDGCVTPVAGRSRRGDIGSPECATLEYPALSAAYVVSVASAVTTGAGIGGRGKLGCGSRNLGPYPWA
jgi:hypothetical protein